MAKMGKVSQQTKEKRNTMRKKTQTKQEKDKSQAAVATAAQAGSERDNVE